MRVLNKFTEKSYNLKSKKGFRYQIINTLIIRKNRYKSEKSERNQALTPFHAEGTGVSMVIDSFFTGCVNVIRLA